MVPVSLQQHSQQILEWNLLVNELSSQAQSSIGAESCRQLKLETDLNLAKIRQQETTEMRAVLESSIPFPILHFEDVRDVFDRAAKGAQLEGLELFHISTMLGLCQEAAQTLEASQESCPTLYAFAQNLDPLVWVKEAIEAMR